MRSHNPTPPRRSSLGVLRALAFIQPPPLPPAPRASAARPSALPPHAATKCAHLLQLTHRAPPATHRASAILSHSRNLPPKTVSKTVPLW